MHTIDHGIRQNFYRWQGRLNRKRYIKRSLLLWLVSIVIITACSAAFIAYIVPSGVDPEHMGIYELARFEAGINGLFTLAMLPVIISSYMLMVRRLHDVNLSGFFVLLNFVPIVNLGLFLYLLCKKGTEGENDYGPDPLAAAESSIDESPYARSIPEQSAPTDIAPPEETPQDPGERS